MVTHSPGRVEGSRQQKVHNTQKCSITHDSGKDKCENIIDIIIDKISIMKKVCSLPEFEKSRPI
jgi:hypothetical protein